MSEVTLYWHPQSPFARMAALTLAAFKIEHQKKVIDLFAGEGKKPEYVKMNPQHNVPFLKVGSFGLSESAAIIMYLAEKYNANNPSLYPLDNLEKKATINHRIVFSGTVAFDAFAKCFVPVAFKGAKTIDEAALAKLKEVLGWVRDFLAPTGFIAGTPNMTVADLAMLPFYTTLATTDDFCVDLKEWPEIATWAEKMKKLAPDYEAANGEGTEIFRKFWQSKKPQ